MSPDHRPATPRAAFAALALLLAVLTGAARSAHADALKEAFVADPSFNGGYLLDDRFATTSVYTDFYASKTARLSNGDIVVAGLVPAAYQVDQANGLFNVGLVRYGPNGERVPWPGPSGAYVSFYDRYLQYPNSYGKYERIAEIIVTNGFIYVLADYLYSATDRYPHLVVFSEAGAYVGTYSAGSTPYEYGVGMVTFVSGGVRKLFSINQASRVLNPGGQTRTEYFLRMYRFNLAADGSVSADAGFGSGGTMAVTDAACTVSTGDCDIEIKAMSLVGSGTALFGPFVVYAAGRLICNPPSGTLCVAEPTPVQVLRLSPSTGSLLGRTIVTLRDADAGNVELYSDVRDVVASRATLVGGGYSDSAYVLARVGGNCYDGTFHDYRRGAGLIRIDGNGNQDTAFGGNGTLLFGGAPPVGCPPVETPTAEPAAMALGAYGRLGVVGTTADKTSSPTHSDGFLAIVRTDRAGVADYAVHPALHFDGTPWGSFAGFADVIAYDGNTFTAAGTATTEYGANQFGTLRFISDRIFADDFAAP